MQFNKAAFKKFLGKTRAGDYLHAPALKKPRPASQHIILAQDAEETPLWSFKQQKKLDSKCNEELLKEFDLSIAQVYDQLHALLTERTELRKQTDELQSTLVQANNVAEEKAMELESLRNQLDASKKEVEKMIVDIYNLRKEADAAKAEAKTLQIRGQEVEESAKKKVNEAVADYKKSEEYEANLNLYAQSAYFGGFTGCKSQVAKRFNELDLSFLDAEAALEDDVKEAKVATNGEDNGVGLKVATSDEAAVGEPEESLQGDCSSTEPEVARENECGANKPEGRTDNKAGWKAESGSRNFESPRYDEVARQDNQFDDEVDNQENQFHETIGYKPGVESPRYDEVARQENQFVDEVDSQENEFVDIIGNMPGDAFDGGAAMQDESGKNAENLTDSHAASQETQFGDEVAWNEHEVAIDNDAASDDANNSEASSGGFSTDEVAIDNVATSDDAKKSEASSGGYSTDA